jgi:hypothetical protein
LKEDESFNKVFLNENKDILIKTLFEKIKSRQYPLKLVHDNKESDYNAKIQVQKLPESYIENLTGLLLVDTLIMQFLMQTTQMCST